jgi:hypothetical protein
LILLFDLNLRFAGGVERDTGVLVEELIVVVNEVEVGITDILIGGKSVVPDIEVG